MYLFQSGNHSVTHAYAHTHCGNKQRPTKFQAQGKGNTPRSVVNKSLVKIPALISGSNNVKQRHKEESQH